MNGLEAQTMAKFSLVLGVHGHQPVGNFPEVCEQVFVRAYRPFLEVLGDFPGVPCVAHYSGVLFDWFEAHHPEFLDRLAVLVDRGQVELLTGGYYEPILAAIPDADKLGQIDLLSRYLQKRFGIRPRGMWLAERVWEPHLAKPLAEAGVEYVLLDDSHFLAAGLPDEALTGYYLTEEQGASLAVFPISQRLRYLVPFHEPEETIAYCRTRVHLATRGTAVIVDDAEKFGGWPGTHERVYTRGWLRRFLECVQGEAHWLQPVRLEQALSHGARGKVYLPAACYTEMMEWALPVEAREIYDTVVARLRRRGGEDGERPFVRGGFWRNFLAKYPEANTMHQRMLRVSRRVHALPADSPKRAMALEELWKGQCNDAFWHGTFGGVYLPHLRHGAFSHLMRAEALAEAEGGDLQAAIRIIRADMEGTGTRQVRVETPLLGLTWDPDLGGSLVAIEHRGKAFNLGNAMTRRPEPYHRRLLDSQGAGARLRAMAGAWRNRLRESLRWTAGETSTGENRSPRYDGLAALVQYDRYPRTSFLDHWLPDGFGLSDFARCGVPLPVGMSLPGYGTWVEESPGEATLILEATASAGSLVKQFRVTSESPSLEARYVLSPWASRQGTRFGIEFNLAMLMGAPPVRFVQVNGLRAAEDSLLATCEDRQIRDLRLVDDWLGLAVRLEFDPPCRLWRCPVATVSVAEVGYELIPQQVALLPHWDVPGDLPTGGGPSVALGVRLILEAWEAQGDVPRLDVHPVRASADE